MSVQVALSVVLLIVSGLVLRTLAKAGDVDPGFQYEQLIGSHISTSSTSLLPEERERFFREVEQQIALEPWVESATVSFDGTNRYEAGGNIFWVNPFCASDEDAKAAGEVPSWPRVHEMADVFRVVDGDRSTKVAGTVAKEKRTRFRTPFHVHDSTLDAFKKTTFPGNMALVTGHVLLYAWFLAMFEALEAAG